MFKSYLTVAVRNLVRQKGYSLINLSGLSIGMACCILILLFVQDELRYDRYHEKADQIYRLASELAVGGKEIRMARTSPAWAAPLAGDYPEVLSTVRIKTPNSRWLIKHEEKEFWENGFFFADSTVFDIFSLPLVRGNPRTALQGPNTVVISESVAKKFFGDEDPIGKVFNAEDLIYLSVTGIMKDMPKNSHFRCDYLASFASLTLWNANLYGNLYTPNFREQGLNFAIYTYILLQKGFPPEELERKFPAFIDKYLGDQTGERGLEIRPFLQPITDIHLHSALDAEIDANSDIRYVYTFSALAFIILLIACINFMNLATARSANRAHEVGLRKVVGAHRGQLIRQFLGESLFLTFLAAVLAAGAVHLLLPWFNTLVGRSLTMVYGDPVMLAGLVGIVLLVGILAGSYPAFFLSAFRPAVVLKGSLKAGASNTVLRKVLVVAQFTMSIMMIIGTVIVYNQLEYVRNARLGFNKEHVVNMRLVNASMAGRYESFKTAVAQHPDILGATGASSVPGGLFNALTVRAEGTGEEENLTLQVMMTDFEYIPAMGIEMAAGRNFSRDFATDERGAVIINETAAGALGLEKPVGQALEMPGSQSDRRLRIIGVVRDFHVKSLHQRIEPLIMAVGIGSNPWYASVRVNGDHMSDALAFIEQTWRGIYPDYPFEYSFLDDDYDNLYQTEQQLGQVFGAFALFSIFITCLGLFGLASFMAEQRIKEIGIRKVLGASITNILVLLSRDFTKLVLFAFVLASPLAYYAMDRWLSGFAYHTDIGLWIFVAAGIGAMVIAWLTVGYQAVKAALSNPVDALRAE